MESFFISAVGREPHKPKGLSWFKRERAEAGALLVEVLQTLKPKRGIAVKRERARSASELRGDLTARRQNPVQANPRF